MTVTEVSFSRSFDASHTIRLFGCAEASFDGIAFTQILLYACFLSPLSFFGGRPGGTGDGDLFFFAIPQVFAVAIDFIRQDAFRVMAGPLDVVFNSVL